MIPSIGRIIHVCIGTDQGGAVYRPAVIVRIWSDDCVNAQVFVDGSNDDRHLIGAFGKAPAADRGEGSVWLTSILAGDGVGQWRWPPRS